MHFLLAFPLYVMYIMSQKINEPARYERISMEEKYGC